MASISQDELVVKSLNSITMGKTQMSGKAAARIQSAAAKSGGVSKGSFAARAQSAASKSK